MWWTFGGVVVVVIIAVVVTHMGGSPSSSNSASTGNQVESASTTAAPEMSLSDLFAAGTSQKCIVSTGGAQGTVYVTSGHMRGDFTENTATGTVTSHMITDGKTAYVWTSAMAQGMSMSFSSMSSMSAQAQAHGSSAPDPAAKANYSCNPWSVDQSEFTLPTNITFTDMSAMMGAAAGASAGASAGTGASAGGSNMCAMCNSISNASQKASCLSAMHC